MNKEVDVDLELQALVGRVLIKTQIFEFLIHGLVSHFRPDILHKTKLKGLTAKVFLSSAEEDKKKRRQTLGQVFEVLREGAKFTYWEELDSYLDKRNNFVHHFWRDYISRNFVRENCVTFLLDLEAKCEEWTRVFRGLLSLMAKAIISRLQDSDKTKSLADSRYQYIKANEPYEKFFYEKVNSRFP